MKRIIAIIILLIFFSGCATKTFSPNESYAFQSEKGNRLVLTVEQLDNRALAFLSKEWAVPVSEFSSWTLYDVTYSQEEKEAILRYDRGLAPRIFVYFDRHGNVIKWQGYK
jgi:hypothetical protein